MGGKGKNGGVGSGNGAGTKKSQFPVNMCPPEKKFQPGFCPYPGRIRIWTPENIQEEALAFFEWMQNPKNFWFKQFATERGYTSDYFKIFSERSEEFKLVYEFALQWQENKVAMLALLKKFDSGISKMVLINNHGWKNSLEDLKESVTNLSTLLKSIKEEKIKQDEQITIDIEANNVN